MRKPSRVQRLRDQGFDESYAIPFERAWKVRCSQCEALVINGVPAHETGCPNIPREYDEHDEPVEPEESEPDPQCLSCGRSFDPDSSDAERFATFCSAECEEEEGE